MFLRGKNGIINITVPYQYWFRKGGFSGSKGHKFMWVPCTLSMYTKKNSMLLLDRGWPVLFFYCIFSLTSSIITSVQKCKIRDRPDCGFSIVKLPRKRHTNNIVDIFLIPKGSRPFVAMNNIRPLSRGIERTAQAQGSRMPATSRSLQHVPVDWRDADSFTWCHSD